MANLQPNRRDFLKSAALIGLTPVLASADKVVSKVLPDSGEKGAKKTEANPPQPVELSAKQASKEKRIPTINHVMHLANPTFTFALPAIASEFYEAKVLIENNFKKHERDPHSSIEALRYDNADAFCRPLAGLIVHLGALLARTPANALASYFTNSTQMQSRFSSISSYYTIVAEVKYLRNPILAEMRDMVVAELKENPEQYHNDPRKINPILLLSKMLSKLCKKRKDLNDQNIEANQTFSKRELNLKRSTLDLMIFAMSLILGLQLNAGSGRAVGGVFGMGVILRDVNHSAKKRGDTPGKLKKLKDRTRGEMITWPALYAFNAVLQNLVNISMPKLFPNDPLAQEHLVELIGSLSQAALYCLAKAPAQAKLETLSELRDIDLWKIIDWYTKG